LRSSHVADLDMDPLLIGIAVLIVTTIAILLLGLGKPSKPKAKFLNKQRQTLTLGERTQLSHDTFRFRFTLPAATPVLGLPVGKHFKVFAPNPTPKVQGEWNGKEDLETSAEIERKYTPTTSDDTIGHVDLVIKVYKGGVIERFPDGGKMSQYFDKLRVGDSISISGPWGMNEYVGSGQLKAGTRAIAFKQLGMLAGGTGITPMLQVMAAVLSNPTETAEISLIYANQSPDDILVRDLLEALAAKYPKRLKLWYTVDRPDAGWKHSVGFITDAMIAEHLPPPAADTAVLMCGPPPMVKFACVANLDKLGYDKKTQVIF